MNFHWIKWQVLPRWSQVHESSFPQTASEGLTKIKLDQRNMITLMVAQNPQHAPLLVMNVLTLGRFLWGMCVCVCVCGLIKPRKPKVWLQKPSLSSWNELGKKYLWHLGVYFQVRPKIMNSPFRNVVVWDVWRFLARCFKKLIIGS